MKYISIFLLLIPLSATAQWRDIGWGSPDGSNGFVETTLTFGAHNHHLFISTPDEGVLREDSAYHWVTVLSTGLTAFAPLDTILFGSVADIQGFQTTNDGTQWSRTGIGGPIATVGNYVLGNGNNFVYRSGDLGQTWKPTSCPAPGVFGTGGPYAFATTGSGIYRSADTGATWKKISPPTNFSLKAFAVIGSNIFIGDMGLYLSTDSGSNWSEISLQNRVVNALAASDSLLFAGTDSGVYISSDLGATWQNVIANMGAQPGYNPNVKLLAVVDSLLYEYVRAGKSTAQNTAYGYVTARPIEEMTSNSGVVSQLPPGDTIETFPNPTTSQVSVIAGGTSIFGIRVLDVLGEQVLRTEYRVQSDITINFSTLASGTYFLEIETSNGIVLRKVVRQ